MLKVLIGFLFSLILVGCSTTNQTSVTYEKYKPTKQIKRVHVDNIKPKKATNIPVNGTIKGHIINLKYEKGIWNYRVKSTDLSNEKLPMAQFTYAKKLAKEGDLVYVIIKNGKLKELFLIKKGNYKKKIVKNKYKKIKKDEVKTHKRTKQRQVLEVPHIEKINLD